MTCVVRALLCAAFLFAVVHGQAAQGFGRPERGEVADCCCGADTVDKANSGRLHSLLNEVVATRFFRVFKVNLQTPCTLWNANHKCKNKGCSVCPCPDDEIPPAWKTADDLDRSLSSGSFGQRPFEPWHTQNAEDLWIVQDDGDPDGIVFIDLMLNPDGHTGYGGPEAGKIWQAIYSQPCLQGGIDNFCLEQRVFFRLISGYHSCTSAHIAERFLLGYEVEDTDGNIVLSQDDTSGEPKYGPHVPLYFKMLGNFPGRVDNLYFTFVFLLRAVNKASEVLRQYDYSIGDSEEHSKESAQALQLVEQLLSETLVSECSADQSFDERSLFASPEGFSMKAQMRTAFRNVSRIMDCTGCEKCKMHGKLTLLGLGTALKILFTENDDLLVEDLKREEVIALINTLQKFSHALYIDNAMHARRQNSDSVPATDSWGGKEEPAAEDGGVLAQWWNAFLDASFVFRTAVCFIAAIPVTWLIWIVVRPKQAASKTQKSD